MLDDTNLIGKISTLAIIGLLSWLVYTTQQMSVSQAVQGAEIKAIQSSIAQVQNDRYTRSEAVADKTAINQRLSELEDEKQRIRERLRDVENQVKDME